MGCISSKQFKRAAEHEDPAILAKETTCKNSLNYTILQFRNGE